MKNLTHDKQEAITANNVSSFFKPIYNSAVYTDHNTSSNYSQSILQCARWSVRAGKVLYIHSCKFHIMQTRFLATDYMCSNPEYTLLSIVITPANLSWY